MIGNSFSVVQTKICAQILTIAIKVGATNSHRQMDAHNGSMHMWEYYSALKRKGALTHTQCGWT